MHIDPRASLSAQLIQQANFGSDRFEPFGTTLRRDSGLEGVTGPLPFRPVDTVELNPPVESKPEARPADVHICDGRLGPVAAYTACGLPIEAEPTTEVAVREVVVPTTLPAHVVGSMLDVLA